MNYNICLYFYANPSKNYGLIRLPLKTEWLTYISKQEAYFNFSIPKCELPKCEKCDKTLNPQENKFICSFCEIESFLFEGK